MSTMGATKNSFELSVDDANTDMDSSLSNINETFFKLTGRHIKKSSITLAVVVTLGVIIILFGILIGILFGYFSNIMSDLSKLKNKDSTVEDEVSVLKYNVSDSVMKDDVSEIWKSVSNIKDDLSKLKDKDSTMNNELSVLKYNVSDSVMKNDVSEIWKSVSNIMVNMSKLEDKVSDSVMKNDNSEVWKSVSNIMVNLSKLEDKGSSMNNELSVLKSNVSNIMDDLSKLKERVVIKDPVCKTCPFEWRLIGSNCYYISTTGETWQRSKELCAGRNGILIVIKDHFEMYSLFPTIKQERYWIGLKRDPNDINMWVWTDGSPLTYSAWNKGEPNNAGNNEHCAEIMGGEKLWNDRPCDHKLNYICKGVWSC